MTRLRRVVASLTSMFVGWAAGFGFYAGYMLCCTPSQRVTDAKAMLFWSAVFVSLSWVLVALPAAMFLRPSSRAFSITLGPLIGAVVGAGAFAALLSWSGLWREPLFLAYAGVVGAAAAITYALCTRHASPRAVI